MTKLIARRLAISVPLLFIVPFLTFVMATLAPGDPARTILGDDFTPEAYQALRAELGLDKSLFAQYADWLRGVVQGDLGTSPVTGLSVSGEIISRVGVTASLVLLTTVVATLIGVGLGVVSALRAGWLAKAVDVISLVGFSFPSFWVGLVLVALFAVGLGWFPATGFVPIDVSPRAWALALVLPITALAVHAIAMVAKQTRDAMLDTLGREYILALRARGIPERSIIFRHALRNAAIPVSTVVGLVFISLLDGTVLVESVFAMPGLGGLVVDATHRHEIPVIQGIVLTFTVVVVLVNLFVDVLYGWLNPKARVS
ncbi:ABC transporter permease [Phytohabitans sp. ZYX-F-186]|uniref:ABC transporter permease n=1 Tax=Phytohabitans maris TaxID=3071409 RepID=A0ABU0ZGT3_9ACTN|nr:ABC transporter permease [Phytohabitans sp. ZYX-F-186]MDQ7905552.1 ABC transporter permease [Phytohabitans sp. ZYX-F-186]